LLHITDMSWGRVSHPSEIVKLGDRVKVVVLDFNEKKERISLGMKQLSKHPWEDAAAKYPEGTRIKGKVVSITDYGVRVEIAHDGAGRRRHRRRRARGHRAGRRRSRAQLRDDLDPAREAPVAARAGRPGRRSRGAQAPAREREDPARPHADAAAPLGRQRGRT